jgi:hypothetical protein
MDLVVTFVDNRIGGNKLSLNFNLEWNIHLDMGIDHSSFEFNGQHVWTRHKNLEIQFL